MTMKKFLIAILTMFIITSCAATNRVVTLGNVSLLSPTGERIRSYNNVVLQEVPLRDTVNSIYFVEQNGTEHFIENSIVVVEGVEQIVETDKATVTSSVVMYPYDYYYPYYRVYYYHFPDYPRPRVAPRPEPRREPRHEPRPQPRREPAPRQPQNVRPAPNVPNGGPNVPNGSPRNNGQSNRQAPPRR